MRRLLLVLLVLGSASACASRPPARPAGAGTAGAASSPWTVGADGVPGQRLYRVQVRRGEESGSLRLVLRVWSARRFELSASDPLGRPLWTLVARDERGAWRREGGAQICRLDPRRALQWPRLGLALPAAHLPAILLGRLPEPPDDGAVLPAEDGTFEFTDGAGRLWRGMLAAGEPVRWSVGERDGELEWRRDGGGARLEVAAARLEIRWREVAREALGGTAPALPAGLDTAPECDLEDLS